MVDWIKKNKLAFALIVIVLFLVINDFFPFWQFLGLGKIGMQTPAEVSIEGVGLTDLSPENRGLIPAPEYAPVETEERLVVEESSMSLVVSGVREATDKVIDKAKEIGGFMVSTSLTHPEEAPFATVIVRVPAEKLSEVLDYYRQLAVKVTSERIIGTDVTAEYIDLEARLTTLEKTKSKFESILNQATEVEDILQVQRELTRLQSEIDALKGRQRYLEQTAELAKITVYLSTDELALPYAPAKPFRPKVIFKLAVRSLVQAFRGITRAVIWISVYSVIWLPILVIVLYLKKRKKRGGD